MNQLSQLIYWGNVAGNLGVAIVFICVALFVLTGGLWIEWTCARSDAEADHRRGYANECRYPKRGPWRFIVPTLLFLFIIMKCFCPSRDTVYAIAASQLDQEVLSTPLAGKAEKALEAWLDRQISPPVTPH